jgi:hypothetical protein
MESIRAHYDRALLIVAALILFFAAISIWHRAAGFGENFRVASAAPALKSASPPGKAGEMQQAAEKLHQPPQWVFGGRSGLFVPEKHFIGANGLPATLQSTMVHPPVPNEWLDQFGLPIQDADVLEQDPDGDGFTNIDEWEGHANPTDPKSHPDYLTKLKLKSYSQEPFRLVFSSWVSGPDGETFAINTIDFKQPTQFLKVGDAIAGTQFKIMNFEEKYQPNQYGTNVDVSELTLRHGQTGEELKLIKEQVAMSPESVATLVYTWPAGAPPQQFEVRKDQEFSLKTLKSDDQFKYQLIDVQPTKAVIVNLQKPNERIDIGLLAP